MKVYVFESVTNRERYGFTTDSEGSNLPPNLGPWRRFKELEMNRGEHPRVGVRTEDVLNDIEKQGFHIDGATVVFSESVTHGPPPKK